MAETNRNWFFEDNRQIDADGDEDFTGQRDPIIDTKHPQTADYEVDDHGSSTVSTTDPAPTGVPLGATVDANGVVSI